MSLGFRGSGRLLVLALYDARHVELCAMMRVEQVGLCLEAKIALFLQREGPS